MVAAADLYLPNECWECIIRFLDTDHRSLESLSLVSKHFLSITNNIRFSLTICDTNLPSLPHLFQRFPNLTSLDFTHFSQHGDLTALLFQVSTSHITHVVVNAMSMVLPKLRKINLSRHYDISDSLLLYLCKNCEFLEEVVLFKYSSLTCDGIASAIRERPSLRSLSVGRQSNECGWWSNGSHDNISLHFTDSLVSLKGLTNLDLPFLCISDMFLSSIAIEVISLRRLVLRDCINYSYSGIFSLLSICQCIQHLDLQYAHFLNNQHIFELSSFLGNLVSVNLSYCRMLDESALFSLVSKCPSLNEIKMECTSIGEESLKNSNSLVDFVVSPQFKSLYLAFNSLLCDENIKMFASIFPNLQLLDLRRCKMIRHLNLTYCLGEKMQGVNFKLSKLEVLNLSHTRVDDKALRVISKNCFGLLKLLLEFCTGVTDKGVKHVLKNCTQLREISLRGCYEVKANIVDMMVFARPTLRKIIAPPGYHFPDKKGEVFSLHGCHVC